jgi:hypothetical protein
MRKTVGARGQLALGQRYAGKHFEVTEREDGVIVMVPIQAQPDPEAWIHTPEMRGRLVEAARWMQDHPPAETDIEAFLGRIDARRQAKDQP